MTEYGVFYSPAALDDLQAIYSYIAYDLCNPISAAGQEARIRKEIRNLSYLPLRYEQVNWEPWHSMNVRKLPIDNFVAYYTVDETVGEVVVLRIFYGGRNVEEIVRDGADFPMP